MSIDLTDITAFHWACIKGHLVLDVVKIFMENAAALSIDLNRVDQSGVTGFYYACEKGHSDVVNIFMENASTLGIDLNAKCTDHWANTAFHQACARGHSDVIKCFLEKDHSLSLDLNAKDCFDLTGFHHACQKGYSDIVKIFMENAWGIDLNTKDKNGMTPFHHACEGWPYDDTKCQDPNAKAKYDDRTTGFHLTCSNGYKDIVELMLNNAENLNIDLTSKNCFGETGFQSAKTYNRISVVNLIKTKMPNIAFYTS